MTTRVSRLLACLSATAMVAVGLVLGTATAASAATVTVPGDHATIAAAPYTQDPVWITSTGAGAVVTQNIIRNGLRGIYMGAVVGTASNPTVVAENDFFEVGFGQTAGVWLGSSDYVTIVDNTFTNTTTGGVDVNLVGGSSNVTITGNSFDNFGNVMVLIANSSGFPSTPQSHDIVFAGNPTAWLEVNNRPLDGFVIEDNLFDNVPYGVVAAADVQLADADAVTIRENRFCTVNVAAIDNRDDTAVTAIDNDFCDGMSSAT